MIWFTCYIKQIKVRHVVFTTNLINTGYFLSHPILPHDDGFNDVAIIDPDLDRTCTQKSGASFCLCGIFMNIMHMSTLNTLPLKNMKWNNKLLNQGIFKLTKVQYYINYDYKAAWFIHFIIETRAYFVNQ